MPENNEPVRIELDGALAGHYVLLNEDALDVGLLEDIQAPRFRDTLDALAKAIVGGDLPGMADGNTREALRRLKLKQLAALCSGVDSAYAVPKS